MLIGKVQVTEHGRKEEMERLIRERNQLLSDAHAVKLPFCPALREDCRKDCRCFIEPRASINLEEGSNTGMLYVYGVDCDNASLVYQGPDS